MTNNDIQNTFVRHRLLRRDGDRSVLAIAAIVLLILLLKYGLPERKERPTKEKRVKSEPTTYALAYVAGGGTGDAPAVEYYTKGKKVVLKLNMFTTPVGKQFDGWYDGSKEIFACAQVYDARTERDVNGAVEGHSKGRR